MTKVVQQKERKWTVKSFPLKVIKKVEVPCRFIITWFIEYKFKLEPTNISLNSLGNQIFIKWVTRKEYRETEIGDIVDICFSSNDQENWIPVNTRSQLIPYRGYFFLR